MKNIELGKKIWGVIKTDLDFDTWYNECFGECVEDAAKLIFSGCCDAETGSICEISKNISKDGRTHNFNFDKENLIEFQGKEGFKNTFYPED